jgi:hypothetical protein
MKSFASLLAIGGTDDSRIVSTAPELTFYGSPSIAYFGVELEVEFATEADRSTCMDDIISTQYPCYFMYDTSLHDFGLEIITHPMSPLFHYMFWARVLPILSAHNAQTSRRTGLHIHMSKEHVKHMDLITYVYDETRRVEMLSVMKRHDNRFCRFIGSSGKSSAVNVTEHTIELRMFQASLDITTLWSYIAFAQTLTYIHCTDEDQHRCIGGVPVILVMGNMCFEVLYNSAPEESPEFLLWDMVSHNKKQTKTDIAKKFINCRNMGGLITVNMITGRVKHMK